MKNKSISCLLAMVMVFSLYGCSLKPASGVVHPDEVSDDVKILEPVDTEVIEEDFVESDIVGDSSEPVLGEEEGIQPSYNIEDMYIGSYSADTSDYYTGLLTAEDTFESSSVISVACDGDSLHILSDGGVLVYTDVGAKVYTDLTMNTYSNYTDVSYIEGTITLDSVLAKYAVADDFITAMNIVPYAVDRTDSVEEDGVVYYRVIDYPTTDALMVAMGDVFDEYVIDAIMNSSVYFYDCQYTSVDGDLYVVDGGRGANINVGMEYYELNCVSEDEYILRVYVEVLDDFNVVGVDSYDIPYKNIDGEFVFTEFPAIR